MIPFQDLKTTNAPLLPRLLEVAERVISSGRYVNGPEVAEFEKSLAGLTGSKYCVAVSTGLDALRLILLAYKQMGVLKDGDEVIVPANTFIATFLAVTGSGLTAVAADVDEKTFCLDAGRLPLTDRTRAVITVHLYGNPCWSPVFKQLHERGILIIEDNAQAIGAASATDGFHGLKNTGALGDAAAFSFYPAKNIGALGDAGAVTTDDGRLAAMIRQLANYGATEKYHNSVCGFNCRMDELQAALLRVKLPLTNKIIEERDRKARLYDRLITNPDVLKPEIAGDGSIQAWHQYVIRHRRRDELRNHLLEKGIATEIHYPVACHMQECYEGNASLVTYSTPETAERLAAEVLSLPIADVTEKEIESIAETINNFQ